MLDSCTVRPHCGNLPQLDFMPNGWNSQIIDGLDPGGAVLYAPLITPTILCRGNVVVMVRQVVNWRARWACPAQVLPSLIKFRYAIRLQQKSESNGSSSLIRAGTLSLGWWSNQGASRLPWLFIPDGNNYTVLTDISIGRSLWRHGLQGCRQRDGLQRLQMDIKIQGITAANLDSPCPRKPVLKILMIEAKPFQKSHHLTTENLIPSRSMWTRSRSSQAGGGNDWQDYRWERR